MDDLYVTQLWHIIAILLILLAINKPELLLTLAQYDPKSGYGSLWLRHITCELAPHC